MNVNVLKPAKAVESAFEKPNLFLALRLILLPTLASIAGRMAYGIDATAGTVYELVVAYVTFFTLLIVVFALGIVLDAEKAKGKFVSVFSALSLIQITQLLIIIASFLAIPLIFPPETIAFAVQAGQSSNTGMALLQLTGHISENPGAVNTTTLGIFLIIGAGISALGIYLLYLCVKRLTETRTLAAALLTLVALTILGLIPV